MQFKQKLILVALSTLPCLVPLKSFAAKDISNAQLAANLQQLSQQTAAMQQQMLAMQKEMVALEKENQQLKAQQKSARQQAQVAKPNGDEASAAATAALEQVSFVNDDTLPEPYNAKKSKPTGHPATPNPHHPPHVPEALPYGTHELASLGGTAVITSPFIHNRAAEDGSDLITNYSSINKDVAALHQRANFKNQMEAAGLELPHYPILELSGELEGTVLGQRNFDGSHENDINFTAAELDMQALFNNWLTGFMNFKYDDSPPAAGARVNNSNVFLDQGFITLGDFNKSPLYATIGQVYVPFGQYDSYLISDPLNKTIFRTKGRPIVAGYRSPGDTGAYGAAFIFRGDTREGAFDPTADERSPNEHVNQYGLNAGYAFDLGALHSDFGASYINNIADSSGMQGTSAPSTQFQGFGDNSTTEVLRHRVPGVDGRAEFSLYDFDLISEYTTATRAFSPLDMTYNGSGAKPRAGHIEGIYNFSLFGKSSNVALGYNRSWESLALNVPRERYAAALNVSIWQNTLATLEVRHDKNYGMHDTASGAGGAVFSPLGKESNAITGEFDVYF
ncbi:MAG: hypothetical protein CMF50_08545 [Legionellales bacterium]|nr:hypothetical protein [Legionellales bacterium]